MVYNPRSLNNKIVSVMEALVDRSIDVAAICETWLTDLTNPTTAVIKSYGFSILHNYREDRRGGGTAIIYRPTLSLAVHNFSTSFDTFEITSAVIKTATSKMLLIVIYRTGPILSQFNQELDLLLSEASSKFDSYAIVGDLNIHFEQGNNIVKQTLDRFYSFGLKKIVNEPTHIGGASLDQVFTFSLRDDLLVTASVDTDCDIGSDHFPVYCDVNISLVRKYFKTIQYRALKNIDLESFSLELSDIADHINTMEGSFGTVVEELSKSALSLLDQHAPLLTKRISVVDDAPWFDKEYRDLRKTRRMTERHYRSEKDPLLKPKKKFVYRKLCAQTDLLATVKKKEYFSQMIENAGSNPKTLYSMVNRQLDRKQIKRLPDEEDIGELTTSFNEFFTKKIETIRDNIPLTAEPEYSSNSFTTLLVDFEPTDIDEIREVINEAGMKCSPADILPQHLYKDNIEILLPTIVKLVNLSMSTGDMEGVKLADIVPLLKDEKLDPNNLKNYRPVSNLTFLGKLIERVVLKRLNEHLTKNDLHCKDQFAYKKDHSTETLLIKIVNDLLIASDEKTASVIMLLDLSAAFDTVDHGVLLGILEKEIGITGTALKWFKSFLTGRTQRIRLGSTVSECITIIFGVPQGSVLGPVLFNLYIRSIYRMVRTLGFKIFGYADDHQIIKSFEPSEQCKVLSVQINQCFSAIKRWMDKFFLQMNAGKTQMIVVGTSNILKMIEIQGTSFSLGTTVRFISTVKNLGIYMDNKLSFDSHMIELKKRCFRTLRNIRKIRFLLTKDQLKTVVNSLVVSCLDYCNGLFYGTSQKLLHQLQLIQNSAAKAVMGKYKHDHMGEDLKLLHWLDIKKRIVFKLALLAHKSVIGTAPLYLQQMFRYAHHGHNVKLIVPYTSSSAGQRAFSVVGPRIFNNLPVNVSSIETTDNFKVALKTYLFTLSPHDVEKLYF